jgi:hypothetical protein
MEASAQPMPATEVAFFRDPAETWFAAEVIRRDRWDEELLQPLDHEGADIRIAFLRDMPERDRFTQPVWLCLLPWAAEEEPRVVVEAAQLAWSRCDSFRPPGPPPEAYLVAGYQALCPPHPPCDPGPGTRDSLMGFLLDRSGALGRVSRECDDGANRLFRLLWPSPDHLAQEILRARIRDDGGRGVLQLVDFLEAAEVAPEATDQASLAHDRATLLARLPAIAYFTSPSDYDRAAALALDWRDRYNRAYRGHFRAVLTSAREIVQETAAAARQLPTLESLNAEGAPVGQEAARRLRDALDVLAALPEGVDQHAAQTGGVVLGRIPTAIGEARLAGAAVLAALDVHRRRRAMRSEHRPIR